MSMMTACAPLRGETIDSAKFVKAHAASFPHRHGMEFDDLEQEGHVGLVKARLAFDPAFGDTKAGISFAQVSVRRSMSNAIRDRARSIRVAANTLGLVRLYHKEEGRQTARDGVPVGFDVVVSALGVDEEKKSKILAALRCENVRSLHIEGMESEREIAIDDEDSNPAILAGRNEEDGIVRAAIDSLPPDWSPIVRMKLGMGCDALTFPRIAEAMGISVNQAVHRYRRAIAQLRDILIERGIDR